MGKYNYTAQDSEGVTTSGVLEANDENEAIGALQGKGYFILSIQPERMRESFLANISIGKERVSSRDLEFFGEQLATLLNGGVPLVRALNLLGEHSQSKALKNALAAVTRDVASGSSLYKAMEKHASVFDSLWISLVQAGEMGGQLPKSLKQISSYIAAQNELKNKVLTALMYPVVLGSISMGVLAFFIIKIVPTFAEIFKSFNLTLPLLTRVIISTATALTTNLVTILMGFVGMGLIIKSYLATEPGQLTFVHLRFSLPFFGPFMKNILVERLLSTLCTLIESGVSIINAITVLEGVFSNNIVFLRALRSVKNDVATGKSISVSFKKAGVFPPLVTEMMWMGEESGKLPDILGTLTVFYREQVDQFVRRFTSIIDPIMVVFIGAVVGVIVLSIFMPIFQLSQIGAR